MKIYTGKISISVLFVFIQTVLYTAFLAIDLTNGSIGLSVLFKYSIIILCFCYALFAYNKSTFFLLQAALFLTVISDLFILILDYYFYGVLTFILVQELYCLRLTIIKVSKSKDDANKGSMEGSKAGSKKVSKKVSKAGSKKGIKIGVSEELKECRTDIIKKAGYAYTYRLLLQITIAAVVCFLVSVIGVALEGLVIASVFYFVCISTNVFTAFSVAGMEPKSRGNLIYAIGMLLFLLCDINVGVFNLSGFISLPEHLYELLYSASSILMWTFYAPAQVLIAISSRYEK